MTAAIVQNELNAVQTAPTTELLFAIANELANLERSGAMLQELVAGKVRSGTLSGMALLDAQDADLLVQHLAELSRFLKNYADGLQSGTPDPLSSALNSVLLGSLSLRLASASTTIEMDQPSGVELF